ncbi:MAG: Jag N-terminal domain-containing protein [Desulfovibrio sp.]|jgi:spoIIIJ-associated protein|nr:Jag N-terminal domain-containing protein [Desulfovibrio sp.]
MNKFKNFQGKTLDEAIMEACGHFGVPREKLEIEIVNDAKSGIFGLVGVKKAEIRAARMHVAETLSSMLEEEGASAGGLPPLKTELIPNAGKAAGRDDRRPHAPRPAERGAGKSGADRPRTGRAGRPGADGPRQDAGRQDGPRQDAPRTDRPGADRAGESGAWGDMPVYDAASADPEVLSDLVRSVVVGLAAPIVGEVPCSVEIGERRVRAALDCGEAAGLLVGREGQTLAALQYLAGRIVARKLGAALRLQIDAGHYHERREDRLRELAVVLAERAKTGRRAQSTRPLSAYQRRIVHLALENDPDVLTRSKGEGLQRRVFIYPKNTPGRPGPAEGDMRFRSDARPAGDAPFADDGQFEDEASFVDDAEAVDGPDPWNR